MSIPNWTGGDGIPPAEKPTPLFGGEPVGGIPDGKAREPAPATPAETVAQIEQTIAAEEATLQQDLAAETAATTAQANEPAATVLSPFAQVTQTPSV